MKKRQYFSAIVLIGFGGYFLLPYTKIPFLQQFFDWPSLLMIVGVALLWQGYMGKETEMIFPGVILFGFGLHFYVITNLKIWPDSLGVFLLIIALAMILRFQKTGAGLSQGILFLLIAGGLLFQNRITDWLGIIESKAASIWQFWPILLIVFGVVMLLKNKK